MSKPNTIDLNAVDTSKWSLDEAREIAEAGERLCERCSRRRSFLDETSERPARYLWEVGNLPSY